MKLCKECAHEVKETATICPYCGTPLKMNKEITIEETTEKQTYTNEKQDKQPYMDNGLIRGPFCKWISLPLCIILGWLGAHKFYERKYFMGVLYAFTLGFWGVGIVLDIINLALKPKYYYISNIPFINI